MPLECLPRVGLSMYYIKTDGCADLLRMTKVDGMVPCAWPTIAGSNRSDSARAPVVSLPLPICIRCGANLTHCIPCNHRSHSLLYFVEMLRTTRRRRRRKTWTIFSSESVQKNCKPIYSGKTLYSRHDTTSSLPHTHTAHLENFSTLSHWPLLP